MTSQRGVFGGHSSKPLTLTSSATTNCVRPTESASGDSGSGLTKRRTGAHQSPSVQRRTVEHRYLVVAAK